MGSYRRVLLPLLYMTGLFALSSIPGHTMEVTPGLRWVTPQWQNLLHVPVFGGLAVSWFWGLSGVVEPVTQRIYAAFALTLLYAVIDETWQTTIPGRMGTITDFGLNTLGALLALSLCRLQQRAKS